MDLLSIKVFSGRLGLTVGDDYHEVELYSPGKKLKKGFGYIKGNYVYIYRGKKEKFKKNDLPPGVYLNKNGEYEFIKPENKQEKEAYHTDNIIELDVENIFKDIAENKENFIDPEDIEIINNNSDAWVPTIREDDDFLKYIIKKVIIDKKVNLKNYRGKFTNQYALNNMKSGLNKDTKMTVTNFKIWCEILGIKWTMFIEDDGTDRMNPLPKGFEIDIADF
jgi:hypothetical protein